MNRNIKPIPIDLIKLDQENVRFGGDIAQNQREAISLLMADPEDARKLLRLTEHIAIHGLDPTEVQLITPDGNGSYITLEGNRRLTALKLLQKPDLCPNERLVSSFIAAHKRLTYTFPSEIECSVVATREEGDMWVELKHTGQNSGVGRVGWDSDIRDERRARQTGVESIGRQIRNLLKENPEEFSEKAIKDIYHIPVTTLTRLFSSKPAQEAFFMTVEKRKLVPTTDLQYISPSIEFAIDLFIEADYNVNDIRSDDDRKLFLNKIPEEIRPAFLLLSEQKKAEKTPEVKEDVPGAQSTPDERKEDGSESRPLKKGDAEHNEPQEGRGKIRARPLARARKYLINWSLNITASRVNAIYRELRQHIHVDQCPNAAAVTFRVLIEVSCDHYIIDNRSSSTPVTRTDNGRPPKPDDKLSVKVQAVAAHLFSAGRITKDQCKAVSKRAGAQDTAGSVDHLNLFVHSSASSPIPSELKDVADEYRPLLEGIWP